MKLPDQCCWLFESKVAFGAYPFPKAMLDSLISNKFTVWLSLVKGKRFSADTDEKDNIPSKDEEKTSSGDNIYNYQYDLPIGHHYIHLPISDRGIPLDRKGLEYVLSLLMEHISLGNRIYIHCRGGHGRSGIIGALLTAMYLKMNPSDSLRHVYSCHQKRKKMLPKYRKIGCPQTNKQKKFVYEYF